MNRDVLFPYLTGKDLNDHPEQAASRWAINFFDWPIERAQLYSECFGIVEREVKPGRMMINRTRNRERWWIYAETRPGMYGAISGLGRVLVIAQVSKTIQPAFVSSNQVLSHKTVVFRYDDDAHFGLLTSAFHWWWALTHTATMRSDPSYSPSDVFVTFAQPNPEAGRAWNEIGEVARKLNAFRAELMIRTQLGLTKIYNQIHDRDEHDPEIVRLRELHTDLDHAVRDAYDWSDLELNHHHWETPQGMRFTVSPEAKDELLDRLLELNHERYAAEVAAGLHDKKKVPAKRAPKIVDPSQRTLL